MKVRLEFICVGCDAPVVTMATLANWLRKEQTVRFKTMCTKCSLPIDYATTLQDLARGNHKVPLRRADPIT